MDIGSALEQVSFSGTTYWVLRDKHAIAAMSSHRAAVDPQLG